MDCPAAATFGAGLDRRRAGGTAGRADDAPRDPEPAGPARLVGGITLPDPVQLAIPAFVGLIILEMLLTRLRGVGRYDWRDAGASLFLGFGSTVAGALTAGAVLAMSLWVYSWRLFEIPFSWWAFLLCFGLDDLA